jgi:hypothetical protein
VPRRFGNEADVSSSSEDDINEEEDLRNSFKIEETHVVSALNKTWVIIRVTTFPEKVDK